MYWADANSAFLLTETAQALEAACWIAIERPERGSVGGRPLSAATHHKCIDAARGGLSNTLMEKIWPVSLKVFSAPSAVSLHQAIMHFPSHWFYSGEVYAILRCTNRSILDYDILRWYGWTRQDRTFKEEFVATVTGRIKSEANLLLAELENYIKRIRAKRMLDGGV